MFEQLKHDVEFILNEVYTDPMYYYRNWMHRIIHDNGYLLKNRKEIKDIFKKWHNVFKKIVENPEDRSDMVASMDKIIHKTSVLKFAKLITDPDTNKEIIDFLCLVYQCPTAKDRALEFFSNKMQNTIFTEGHNKQRKQFINYNKGVLVLDNLGIIEKSMVIPNHYVSFPFYNQIVSVANSDFNEIPIASGLVGKKEFNICRNYLHLGTEGHVKCFEVLDGEVRADIYVVPELEQSELLGLKPTGSHDEYILRPIYLVEGQGLVSDPDLVKLDRLKCIAGFDLCEKPSKL